jgi:hypothetical protein
MLLDRVQEHLPRSPNARKGSTVRGVLHRAPGRIRRGPASAQRDTLTAAGVQARDISSDVTSGSKEAKSRPACRNS